MAYEFKLPDLGEGLTEGEIVEWLVREGDSIEEGQVFVKVETDKAVLEIPSPRKGTVLQIGTAEGETVQVGEVILVIGEEGEKQKEIGDPKMEGPVEVQLNKKFGKEASNQAVKLAMAEELIRMGIPRKSAHRILNIRNHKNE